MQNKLTRGEAINLLNAYLQTEIIKLDWFQCIQAELVGIVFYGSTAKGLNRPDSDLDMLLFVPLAVEEAHTNGEYSYQYQGREINIVLRSIERMRELAQTAHDNFQAEVFRGCEILRDPKGELAVLIGRIRDGNATQVS